MRPVWRLPLRYLPRASFGQPPSVARGTAKAISDATASASMRPASLLRASATSSMFRERAGPGRQRAQHKAPDGYKSRWDSDPKMINMFR